MSSETTTAISHVSIITIQVKDQDAALRFYTEALGFEKRTDAPMGEGMRWLTVAPAGSSTEFSLMNAPHAGAPLGSNTGVVLETDDLAACHRILSARGVQFTEQPSEQFFGGWAMFADQDGNTFGLHAAHYHA